MRLGLKELRKTMMNVKGLIAFEKKQGEFRENVSRDGIYPAPENKIDRELSPPRYGTKARGYGWKEPASKWGGYGSGYDTGARSSNQAPTSSGTKRSLAAPASPEGIAKVARHQWENQEPKMRKQTVEMYPKYFTYFAGELHFYAKDVLRGSYFMVEPYAPRL